MTSSTKGERLYRMLLRFYPRAFRQSFADEMAELMRDRLRASQRAGAVATTGLWLRVLIDLALSAPAERWHELRNLHRTTPGHSPGSRGTKESIMFSIVHDLHHAWRGLCRRPLVGVTVVAVLGLGIGANAVLFSLVDTVLIRALPFEEPDRLVMIWNRYGSATTANAAPDFVDRLDASTLDGVAAMFSTSRALRLADEQPEQVTVTLTTSTLFPVLRVQPELGAPAFPSFDGTGDGRQAVLSYALWQRRFGGDRGVVGRTIQLDGEAHQITAVMPRQLDGPDGTDLWLPLMFAPEMLADDARGNEYLSIVARLGGGISRDQAQAEMDTIAAAVIENIPDRGDFLRDNGWGAQVVPMRQELVGDVQPALVILFAAVGAVLLLACANVANLLLVRMVEQSGDLAVRLALGADRRRLWSLILSESIILAAAGCVVGIAGAWVVLTLLPRVAPYDLPGLDHVGLDPRVVLFVLLLSAVVAVVSGLIPAWRAGTLALRRGSRTVGRRAERRLQRGLVVYELATATVLLVAAGLLLRSFATLANVDPGFDSAGRLAFRVSLPATGYPDRPARRAFQAQMLDGLRALPGVRSASFGSRLPLANRVSTGTFDIEGYVPGAGEQDPGGDLTAAGDAYFASLGIPVLAGREFGPGDREAAERVVVVDQWLADRYWPAGDAIGQRINLDSSEAPVWRRIVGIVGHVKTNALDEDGRFQVYAPASQSGISHLDVVLRAEGSHSEMLVPAARQVIFELDESVPVYDIRTLDEQVVGSIAMPRWNARILGAFALTALGLAAFGLYGLLAYTVSRRGAEIGLRMALGASSRQILRSVVGDGLRLVALGLTLGLFGSMIAARLLRGLLFGVTSTNPAIYLQIVILLGTVAILACLGPARRAARLDPVAALREG